jgi:hypothetical protein
LRQFLFLPNTSARQKGYTTKSKASFNNTCERILEQQNYRFRRCARAIMMLAHTLVCVCASGSKKSSLRHPKGSAQQASDMQVIQEAIQETSAAPMANAFFPTASSTSSLPVPCAQTRPTHAHVSERASLPCARASTRLIRQPPLRPAQAQHAFRSTLMGGFPCKSQSGEGLHTASPCNSQGLK